MRLLPKLFTASGTLAVPMSDRTAELLVDALLTDDRAGRQSQLREALAGDGLFAWWALCRGAQAGRCDLHTSSELAAWLGESAVFQLQATAGNHSTPEPVAGAEKWAELAAFSLVVARLSGRIAESTQGNPCRTYLLGLLHGVSEGVIALCAGDSRPGSCNSLSGTLPDWLMNESSAIRASRAERPSSDAECVALAIACLTPADGKPQLNFDFDAAEYLAELSKEGQAWLETSPRAEFLGPLVTRLARLENLEQRFDELLENEKLESLKELAYGAGHEINNPLANISARAQTLLQEERDPERRRKLAAINTQAFRAHEMIADMMLFARPPQPNLGELDLATLVGVVVGELAAHAAGQNTEFAWSPPAEPIYACADKTQIGVAVKALCINALEALVTGGRVEVSISTADSGQGCQYVQIAVSDNGPGISAETRRHIFDPFFSGREAGRGLGFGLSKCWRIAGMHGGRIDVESASGAGARFTITLPASGHQ